MSEQFHELVERVVERLAPIPVVTPAQYRAIACNRCGSCCDDVRAEYDPDTVALLAADPNVDADRRRFLAGLEPIAQLAGGWRYRCRHFSRDADSLGLCAIYATRPQICSAFPYGRVVRNWSWCAWYVQVRDESGTPIHEVPASLGLGSTKV
jgi:Fe-S-cluster containining protein